MSDMMPVIPAQAFVIPAQSIVIPAQAGIHDVRARPVRRWIPACAGMTKGAGLTLGGSAMQETWSC
jgi:hypothetical protein